MCGIVGVAGEITVDLKKTFNQMLIVDQLRGDHSTGVLSVRNHDELCKITKVLGGPSNLDDSKSYNDQYTDYNKVLLGHNRYATSGKVTARNAHPFEFDSLVGVHNGSLRNYTQLPGYGKFNVDTEVLYDAIDQIGLEASLAKITGAYTLVYWDKDKSQMVFIRNNERPLYMAFTEGLKSFLWASEAWMLEGCAQRNNVKLDEIFLLKPDTLVTLPIPTIKSPMKLHAKLDVKGGTAVYSTPVVSFRQQGTGGTTSNTSTTGSTTKSPAELSAAAFIDGGKAITETTPPAQEAVSTHESPINRDVVQFVCGMKGCDSFGAKYIHLFRAGDPRKYRLYLKRSDYGQFDSADRISGQVGGMKMEGDVPVYKVTNLSVINLTKKARLALAEKANQPLVDRAEQLEKSLEKLQSEAANDDPPFVPDGEVSEVGYEEQTEDTGELFLTENGKYIGKEEFRKKHQFCSYCTGNIDPSEGYRFIKGEILCEACSSDKVLVDSLT